MYYYSSIASVHQLADCTLLNNKLLNARVAREVRIAHFCVSSASLGWPSKAFAQLVRCAMVILFTQLYRTCTWPKLFCPALNILSCHPVWLLGVAEC